jgi:hypothetical protein
MHLTPQQRKFFLWCAVIAVGWYVVRGVVDTANRAAYLREQAIRAQRQKAKPKPKPAPPIAKTAPTAPPAAGGVRNRVPARPLPKPAPPSPFAKLSGVWRGRVALDGRGICDLKFELKEKPDEPGHFSGFSTMTCNGAGPMMPGKRVNARTRVLDAMDPEAAILTGTAEPGSIEFHVDKTVGTDSNGCAPTSFSVTPFGNNQLAAEWREGSCGGGRVILHKARG